MELTDSHVHLQDETFIRDLDSVLDRARQAGVRRFICNGTRVSDWPRVAELAQNHPDIIPCFGLHPWFVNERDENWLEKLSSFLHNEKAGVGETGLDRWIKGYDESAQETCFRAQLKLARYYQKPAMVHVLRAWDWLMKILKDEKPPAAGLLLHGFGGPADLIEPLIDKNAYFSVAGNILRADKTRAHVAVRKIPADRLLIETDAPDMPPPIQYCIQDVKTIDGKPRNEPANLPLILEGIANLRDEPPQRLAEIVSQNADSFFMSK